MSIQNIRNVLSLFFIIVGISSCTTIRQDGSVVKHYFGYVKVITPPTVGNVENFRVMEVSTSGLRIENGLGVGYFYERNEYIPLDCRLVVRVVNEKQLHDVVKTLSLFEKEGLCATVDSQ